MVKWADGKFWVFAGADRSGGKATFSIPCIGNATANAPSSRTASFPCDVGRSRTPSWDLNAIHIYQIDGGSNCGLK